MSRLTVSTCGIVPKIDELANENIQVNLAISLHAPNNKLRETIMPINKVYSIEMVIDSIKNYIKKTNRRVTFEYVMLKGINDSKETKPELSNILTINNIKNPVASLVVLLKCQQVV